MWDWSRDLNLWRLRTAPTHSSWPYYATSWITGRGCLSFCYPTPPCLVLISMSTTSRDLFSHRYVNMCLWIQLINLLFLQEFMIHGTNKKNIEEGGQDDREEGCGAHLLPQTHQTILHLHVGNLLQKASRKLADHLLYNQGCEILMELGRTGRKQQVGTCTSGRRLRRKGRS